MTKTMMREMMVAASLFAVTACGTVEAPQQPADDPAEEMTGGSGSADTGSGSGSGSGSSSIGCTSPSDCKSGETCHVVTGQCFAADLTLDASEFVVDGDTWWVSTATPTLKGTFKAPPNSVVTVQLGTDAFMSAVIVGAEWHMQVPPDGISSAGTLVTVRLTDPFGGETTVAQELVVDAMAPSVSMLPSKVRDERGDVVTFSIVDGPKHDHRGVEVDLSAGGCPTVHKYTYLMNPSRAYGDEWSPNPLRWQFAVDETRIASATYRVRSPNGSPLTDWLPAVVQGTSLSVAPTLAAVPNLGEGSGTYSVDVRVRDWAGNETTTTACWNHQPLAAPLGFGSVYETLELAELRLIDDSPISKLLTGEGVTILGQWITQFADEPIVLSGTTTAITGTYQTSFLNGVVYWDVQDGFFSCEYLDCINPPPPAAVPVNVTGQLANAQRTMTVIDLETDQPLTPDTTGRFTIPARAAGMAAKHYVVFWSISNVTQLRPASTGTFAEYQAGGLTYTGTAPALRGPTCLAHTNGTCWRFALGGATISAIDSAKLAIDPITVTMMASVSETATPHVPYHAAVASFVSEAITWDAGNDDLPGTY